MDPLRLFGSSPRTPPPSAAEAHRRVVRVTPLSRVLAFTGRSIDDVVNDPIVKREVLGYYKLQRWVARGCEEIDLGRQWAGRSNSTRKR